MSKRQKPSKHRPNSSSTSGTSGSGKPNFEFSGVTSQRFSSEKLGPRVSEYPSEATAECSASCAPDTATSCSATGVDQDDTDSPEAGTGTGTDEVTREDIAAASERFQVIDISKNAHRERLSEVNLRLFQSVPAFLLEIVEVVTLENMAFDLRGQLKELRIVFEPKEPAHAVIGVHTEGHAVQAFNIQLEHEHEYEAG